jgi:hypothetical protein
LRPFWASLVLLSGSCTAVAAPAEVDPVELFRSACLVGEVHLDPTMMKTATFDDLPKQAKTLIGRAIYRGPGALLYPEIPPSRDLPNPIYKVRKDLFLIAPTPDAVPDARFADSCIVVWGGDGYLKAHDVVFSASPVDPTAHKIGVGYISANNGGQVLTAALFDHWTILRASPEASEHLPSNISPGAKN